ncbi:MAG: MATE family efflux transporter [Legionella longbeachae]|nr:MATE family efflux transporter [Legionella longbeachae]
MSTHILKNELVSTLKLAIPLALTGVVGAGVSFFETLFLAHVNQETLAAGALVSWLYGTFAVIIFGTLSSINVLISHKHGANDSKGISLVVRDGLLLSLLLAIPAFLLFWNISPLLLLFGQHPPIVLLANSYLHALAWGLLPNLIAIAMMEILIGFGNTRAIMALTVFGVSLVVFFSYMLIFGHLGFPALGIAGAGWGMTISYWIIATVLSVYVVTHKEYKKYFRDVFTKHKPSFLWELVKIGVPMGIMYCFEVAFFFALTLVMGSLGSQLLAANQIALQYMGAFMSVIFSIAQAITVRMGHLLGAKEIKGAKHTCYAGVFISATLMSIIAICYWWFPVLLISVDIDVTNPGNFELINEIKVLFAISALFQIVEAIRISLFGALRALKDTHFTLLISIISFWCIALPVGYMLATNFHFGAAGLWYGMIIGATISGFLLSWRFQFKISYYMPTS